MSAEWWRAKDGDGYTSDITRADPWDITRKHTAREWVLSGEEPDMVAALARYNRENPRGRGMQYMGGKSRIAKKIREHLVSHGATRYVEPFVGGGAVLTAMARDFEFILAADAHSDLIAMYRAIQDGSFTPPETVTEEEHSLLRDAEPSPLRTFAGFACCYGGSYWSGYARNNRGDNYARQGQRSLSKSAKAGMFDSHVVFRGASVFELDLPEDLSDTVIYCDPPYAGTAGYSTGEFDTAKAWELYRAWAGRGAHVYVSEYSGPESFLVDTFTPQGSMGKEQRNRVTEKLFYIPPTREVEMTKPNPFRDMAAETPAVNHKLNRARRLKNDEFYTLRGDVVAEMVHYRDHFAGARVYLPADNPDRSVFWEFFTEEFHELGLAEVCATHYTPGEVAHVTTFNGVRTTMRNLAGDGDMTSPECQELARGSVVVTNPPFSLFREYAGWLLDEGIDFILLGHQTTGIGTKALWPYIQSGRMRLGVTARGQGSMNFVVPDTHERTEDYTGTREPRQATVAGIAWFTTLDHGHLPPRLALSATYDPDRHRPYDDAPEVINIDRMADIPRDYPGVMGVPISGLRKIRTDQFDLVGSSSSPSVDGQAKFQRILVRNKDPEFRPKVSEAWAIVSVTGPPMTITAARWLSPNIHQLPRVEVPDHQAYYPHISAWLATGQAARDAVDILPAGAVVAVDTETMGLGADSFTLKCFTAAWETADGTVSVLLDPTRRDDDRDAVREILERAGTIVIQNAAFDVPPLHQNGLMSLADISKVHDTVIYARMAYPDPIVNKSLESLATKLVGFPDAEVTMAQLFKANGLTTAEGFRAFDIDKPIYRLGAMADTVATLRLLPQIQAKAWSRLAEGHPFGEYGVDSGGAVALMEREQEVNRIMLRRSARGLQVDTDYLETYEETHAAELTAATDAIQNAGLDPDAGNLGFLLVTKLEERGELPADWPRTDSGRLRATKDDLPKLDHPLAASVRKVAELTKVTGYLTKVQDMVRVTGRVHPQVGILKASATGRMAYSWPELQQFPSDARPIIVSDTGLTSVDWSQIEPVVMANCAQDWGFLEPFEAGGDLYAPIVEAAGVTRKVAKVLLLAAMYGQGRNSMAAALGISTEEAQRLQAGMFSAMPTTRGFIDRLRQIGEDHGLIITADGRVLPIPKDPKTGAVFAYKAVNYFCVTPDTLILTEDLRHVRAEEIRVGDGVVGFDEYSRDSRGRGTGKRFFRHATVTNADVTYKESVEIRTSDGKVTTCSDDHRWLVRSPGRQPRLAWVESKDLTPDMQLLSLGTWDTADTRDGGYLAGLYDGEGCLTNRTTTGRPTNLLFSQNKGAVMDGFLEAMDRLGLTYSYVPKAPGSTSTTDTVRVSGLARMMRTIGTLRPERFIARARDLYDGAELHTTRMMEGTPHVVSVTPVGKRKVLAIGTTTRTLVANGYLSHNCQGSAYSVLADTIIRMEAAGLGDSIHLALHDELVVDTEAAEAVAEIMRTPPEFLLKWTGGRVPVFKTDTNHMGTSWAYV